MGKIQNVTEEQWKISTNAGDLARYHPVEIEIYRHYGPDFIEKYGLSMGVALQIIEYLKAAETVFQRLATLDDIATVSGQTKGIHSTNVNKLIKKQILMKYREGGVLMFLPHPRFFTNEIGRRRGAQVGQGEDHLGPLKASDLVKNDTNAGNPIAQETIFAHGGSMKSAVDMYRAMRDEIWSRMGEGSTKRARTLLMIQIMDVLAASGGENEWVPIAKIAEASGGSLALVSRFTSDLQRQKFLERTERVVVDGERYPTVLARMNREFLGAVLQRASSYSSSPVSKGSQQNDNSSNAPST